MVMKYLIAAILLAGLVIAEGDVVVLTNDNFDKLTSSGTWLLEFYAPWCGHCKKLGPIYDELATKVKGQYNIAKIDCTVETDLQKRFSIRGYPTIKLLKDGKLYEYNSQRTIEAFTSYLEGGYTSNNFIDLPPAKPAEQPAAKPAEKAAEKPAEKAAEPAATGPSDVVVLTEANFDQLTSKDTWYIEFYAPWCGHCKKLAPIYEEVATALKDSVKVGKIDCTVEKAICTKYNIPGYPTIQYVKNGEMRQFNGQRTVDGFKGFANHGWETVTPKPRPGAEKPQLVAMPGQPEAAELTELIGLKAELHTLKGKIQEKEKTIAELVDIILEAKPSALPAHLHPSAPARKAPTAEKTEEPAK